MPPEATDLVIMLKPKSEWVTTKDYNELAAMMIEKLESIPGVFFEASQPIQMRFNELIAGVREDLAVKIFGDEFEPMLRAAGQIASILRTVEGATNVKVEQVTGLPVLEIKIDKSEIARRGLSLSEVQDVIGIAIGGRAAGLVFEGDRRFQIIVRLPDGSFMGTAGVAPSRAQIEAWTRREAADRRQRTPSTSRVMFPTQNCRYCIRRVLPSRIPRCTRVSA